MTRRQKQNPQQRIESLQAEKLKLENQKLRKEIKKLDLECEKTIEETIAIKIKRRVLVVTLFFTGIGLFLQFKK